MSINFPDSPTLNQQFTSGGTTWIWDGTKWNLYLGANIVTTADLSSILSSYAVNTSPTITGQPSIAGYQKEILYSSTPPLNPYDKQIYANSLDNSIYIYNQQMLSWISIGGSPDSDQTIIASRMFS
jgi:hypothetical protein